MEIYSLQNSGLSKSRLFTLFLSILFLTWGCSRDNKSELFNINQIKKSVVTEGIFINSETLKKPVEIEAGTPFSVKAGSPTETYLNSITKNALPPGRGIVIKPKLIVPGSGEFQKPEVVKTVENPVFCNAPEVVAVKDAYVKDINPYNFSSFSKLQGLRHDQIRSMIQDNLGNLWLGTDDGLTRYDGKFFSHFTTEQGLVNNLILSVFQDDKGDIWFGTFRGGVTRFDGKYFTNFSTKSGLFSDVVNFIFQDSKGSMWFATGAGVVKYEDNHFTFLTVKEGLCNDDTRTIAEDKNGNIWIGTNGGGISVYDGAKFFNYSVSEGFIENFINTLYSDKSGNLWIGTASKGVIKYSNGKFQRISKDEGLPSNLVRTIYQDKEGKMWFGTTDSGVTVYDGSFFTTYTTNEGLNSNYIRSVLQDNNGNIWLGTRGAGLTRLDGITLTHFTENEGLSNNRVMNILKARDGTLWFGTFGGYITKSKVINDRGIRKRSFSVFGSQEGLLNSRIYSLLEDNKGNIWIGTDGGGVTKFDGEYTYTYTTSHGLCNDIIRKVFQDSNGDMWFASYGAGVSKFDGKKFTNYSINEGISSNNILTVFQDSKGRLWFGTDGGGLTLFNRDTIIHYNKDCGFFSNTVYSIIEDDSEALWFGTGGEGVVRFDGEKFELFNESSGLNNGHILSLFQDSGRNIWAGSRFGLNLMKSEFVENPDSTDKIVFESFDYEDGFLGIGCNLGAINEDNEGTIWIGTNDRLTSCNLNENMVNAPPVLKITNVQLFNEKIPWSELANGNNASLELPNGVKLGKIKFSDISNWHTIPQKLSLTHKQNYITFSYIGITHSKIKKITYQYMLEGLDNTWCTPNKRTEVSYGNLKPGSYTFKVRAFGSSGVASNEESLKFNVIPPWWQSWWFYMFLLAAFILSIYFYISYRERKLNEDKERLKLLVEEQTKELILKNDQLSITNKEKDKLYSIIAHDLKGPFSSFLGLTQIMAKEIVDLEKEDIRSFAESLYKSANNLYKLLENLLQWSRMQQSAIPFSPAPLLLKNSVSFVITEFATISSGKNLSIENNIPERITVLADSNMLHSVIRNLLSNAIKFTHSDGKIVIDATETENKMAEVFVKDSGIGMNNEMISNLFTMNIQKTRKGTDDEPSTGLGLLICKEFIEKHGGTIEVSSVEGKGTEFRFTIPLAD